MLNSRRRTVGFLWYNNEARIGEKAYVLNGVSLMFFFFRLLNSTKWLELRLYVHDDLSYVVEMGVRDCI